MKEDKKREYVSPQVNVMEMQTRHMLAGSDYYAPAKDGSGDGTEQYGNGNTDSWF